MCSRATWYMNAIFKIPSTHHVAKYEEVDEPKHDPTGASDDNLQLGVVAQVHAAVRDRHEEQDKTHTQSRLRHHLPLLANAQQRLQDQPQTETDGVCGVARGHAITRDAAAARAIAFAALAQAHDQNEGVDNGEYGDEEEGEDPRPATAVEDELKRDRHRHEVRHHAVEGEDDVPEANIVGGGADAEECACEHIHAARTTSTAFRVIAAERAAFFRRGAWRVLGCGDGDEDGEQRQQNCGTGRLAEMHL
ncbi:hypothetical protein GQ600_9890 [Phytophthora cactorum]|nr:hypothetical protein GQ600_9890 [Phytophthora cactorum]